MKRMTKWLLVFALLLAPMSAFAGVLDGTPFAYTGTVKAYISNGEGMVLRVPTNTNTREVKIYSLGPMWYWIAKGVPRPPIGTTDVMVVGYNYNGINYPFRVKYESKEIFLRNAETGAPLWTEAENFIHTQQQYQYLFNTGQTAN